MSSTLSNEEIQQITSKFGGTSVATPDKINELKKETTNHTVVSAPGKLTTAEVENLKQIIGHKITEAITLSNGCELKLSDKVTDMLIACLEENNKPKQQQILEMIKARFEYLTKGLKIYYDLKPDFRKLKKAIKKKQTDVVLSRGEYLNAKLLANYLGKNFIDAKDIIFLNKNGEVNRKKTQQAIKKKIQNNNAVIPGFYGKTKDRKLKTLGRGGSDTTGAFVAAALKNTYYNMTDVNGVYTADPKIVEKPQHLDNLTYAELRTLGKYGANVFHASATIPGETANITTQIRKTGDSSETCTTVTKELPDNIDQKESRLLGITALGEKDKIKQVVQDPKAVPEGQILISIIYRNLNDEIKNNIQSIIKEKNLNIQPIRNQDEESVISYLVDKDQKDNTIQTLHSALCEQSSTTE